MSSWALLQAVVSAAFPDYVSDTQRPNRPRRRGNRILVGRLFNSGCVSAPGTLGKNSGVLYLPICSALGGPLPGVAPINLQLSPSPDSGRAFGLAPFHGRRDPREGIGGGHHGFRIHIDERLGEDPAARVPDPSQRRRSSRRCTPCGAEFQEAIAGFWARVGAWTDLGPPPTRVGLAATRAQNGIGL